MNLVSSLILKMRWDGVVSWVMFMWRAGRFPRHLSMWSG